MIVAIVPARGGSKRIPNKNVTKFCGQPLLSWTIKQAKKSTRIDTIYVSTDDEKVKTVAINQGAVVIDRPMDISGDYSPSEDALKHAVKQICLKNRDENIDLVVFLQATSPLRETKDIDNAIDTIKKNDADSLFSAAKLGDFFIWKKTDGKLKSVNYDYLNRKRGQDFEEQYVENGSIYIFKPEILFKKNNRLGGKISISIMEFWKSFEIDEKEDIEFCENLFKLKKLDIL